MLILCTKKETYRIKITQSQNKAKWCRLDHGFLSETYETLFQVNLKMNQIRNKANEGMKTNSLNLALSNKYLEVIIECLELEMFNENVEVIFDTIDKVE